MRPRRAVRPRGRVRVRPTAAAIALALAVLSLGPRDLGAQHFGITGEVQGEVKIWRVGILRVGFDRAPASLDGLREGLKLWGLEEGKNIVLDWRSVADEEAARATAEEFVKGGVDAIVAVENPAVRAAKAATPTIPILLMHATDPVANGFVRNKVHPEGNVTGYAGPEWETPGRQLAVFKEIVPKLRRVLVLTDPADPEAPARVEAARTAAGALKLQIVERAVKDLADVERAFVQVKPGNTDGAYVVSPNLRPALEPLILRVAAQRRVPLAAARKEGVAQGALFFFGPDARGVGRAVARYLDRVLRRGVSVWDMGIEFSQSELVVNLRTAKTLGLTVPPLLLKGPSQVIR